MRPKKGTAVAKRVIGDPNDPDGLGVWTRRYLEHLRMKNYSERTIENRESYLGFFVMWAEDRSVAKPTEVTKPILETYQRHLFHMRMRNGRPLTFQSQVARLIPVRGFFKWLARTNVILWNPASELELPRVEHRIPRSVLSESEVERVMMQADITDPIGLRDRAILEVLYSTGMRRMELINLKVTDIDGERGTVLIQQGKGKKDRMIPIGERAVMWLSKYLDTVRADLVVPPDDGTIFLTNMGEPLSPNRLTQVAREYVAAAVSKTGACHIFRHTMATLMLEGGADIRFIQEMLGHVELSTTQIYTRVSIRKLKQVHEATHPSAKLERRPAAPVTEEVVDHVGAVDDLLGALAAEADEEDDPAEPEAE